MALKLVALFATLACASAGYLEPATTYAAAPVAYSSYSAPALTYSSPSAYSYGYQKSAPALTYSAPITRTYAAPALSYSAPIARTYAAPALSYSTPIAHTSSQTLSYSAPISQTSAQTLSYSAPISHGYAAAAPALSYARSYAPALQYARSYAPALSYNNQGYSSYAAPLATKTVTVAQPAAIAHSAPVYGSALSYAPAHATSYTSSYMNYNSPLIAYAY